MSEWRSMNEPHVSGLLGDRQRRDRWFIFDGEQRIAQAVSGEVAEQIVADHNAAAALAEAQLAVLSLTADVTVQEEQLRRAAAAAADDRQQIETMKRQLEQLRAALAKTRVRGLQKPQGR